MTTVENLFQKALKLDEIPILRDIFEDVAGECVDVIREWLTTPVSMLVNGIELSTAWDCLETYEDCIAFVFYAPTWDARIVIGLDKRMIHFLLEGIFGGDGSSAYFDDSRAISVLEMRFGKEIATLAARAMSKGFERVTPLEMTLERVEPVIEFTMLGQADFPVTVCQVLLQVMEQGGRMFIMMPQNILHQIRGKLSRSSKISVAPRDPQWTQQMHDTVVQSGVELHASLAGPKLTLDDVANLQVGDLLPAELGSAGGVYLSSGSTFLFQCRLGRSQGQIAVRVEEALVSTDEVLAMTAR